MNLRTLATAIVGCLLIAGQASAASSDVTFQVPLNLTKLAADITKVAVTCAVFATAGRQQDGPIVSNLPAVLANANFPGTPWGVKKEEIPVTGGQVVTTKAVLVAINDTQTWHQADHYGETLAYVCYLEGFSARLQHWDSFSETQATDVFRLSPTPAEITGTFTW